MNLIGPALIPTGVGFFLGLFRHSVIHSCLVFYTISLKKSFKRSKDFHIYIYIYMEIVFRGFN